MKLLLTNQGPPPGANTAKCLDLIAGTAQSLQIIPHPGSTRLHDVEVHLLTEFAAVVHQSVTHWFDIRLSLQYQRINWN